MAEHWSEFFTLSQPRTRERDRIVLASTTDSQEALDEAARRRRDEAATDPEVVYAEVMPATPNVDGGVEHGALLVKSNIPERDEEEPCALEKMTLGVAFACHNNCKCNQKNNHLNDLTYWVFVGLDRAAKFANHAVLHTLKPAVKLLSPKRAQVVREARQYKRLGRRLAHSL